MKNLTHRLTKFASVFIECHFRKKKKKRNAVQKKNFFSGKRPQKIHRQSERFLVKMEPHGAYITGPPVKFE